MSPERWRQVTGAFHAALAREAAPRGALLDQACAGDAALRAEVEAMLYAHPGIQEACVIGAPDGYRGETVKALIVPKQAGLKPEDIIEWARDRMAAFKVPRVVQFVEKLPKTATGKILWRELQEQERRK